jgi:hypothetical protein
MRNIDNLIRKVIKEQSDRYMFFSNLEQIRRQCDILLSMNRDEIDSILDDGHDWAQDHIAEAKNNLDQVFDFLMNETEGDGDMEVIEDSGLEDLALADEANGMNPNKALALSMTENSELTEKKKKNVPTNPSLWQSCLNWAKSRYKVCPSAYCNGAAAKRYKQKGGKWKIK